MRIGSFLVLLSLLLSTGVQAQQSVGLGGGQGSVNKLTAKQIADGWIQLFDGATDYGWKPHAEGKWTVVDGALVSPVGQPSAISTTTEFGEGELHIECARGGAAVPSIELHVIDGDAPGLITSIGFPLRHPADRIKDRTNVWTSYDFVEKGKIFETQVNGKPKTAFEMHSTRRGYVRLLSDGKGPVQFRNIRFKPTGLKSVFNGKDLTGWIAPEGNKSVFTVTKEGWLNLKGGRGDLQTIEQWGDFVLQIDVYTNGDHLNSGVFFRAEAGKFEQGYEDQIRNEWQGDDRMKPVDYGTGAIYNRLPVRKVVSSDREWFTMTLVAHGSHFGSWVNGIMVCDFTDMRPPDQTNARKGARTKAGVISLQGHEPDTDLNFRNIRVVELPAVAK